MIGAGEVGTAIAELLRPVSDVALVDTDHDAFTTGPTMHIAFPWSPEFDHYVRTYQAFHRASLTVIHSTVPVGTAARLGAVASPVRGRHPHLLESLRTFPKFFGGARAREAAEPFNLAGVPIRLLERPEEAEAGKLFELAQFGLQVVVEKSIYDWCVARGLDPDVVYTQFASTYNAGYRALGEPQFARPVLTHVPGPIGGHCVVPGTALIEDSFIADLVGSVQAALVEELAKARADDVLA